MAAVKDKEIIVIFVKKIGYTTITQHKNRPSLKLDFFVNF